MIEERCINQRLYKRLPKVASIDDGRIIHDMFDSSIFNTTRRERERESSRENRPWRSRRRTFFVYDRPSNRGRMHQSTITQSNMKRKSIYDGRIIYGAFGSSIVERSRRRERE
jgi:hypothetical protein